MGIYVYSNEEVGMSGRKIKCPTCNEQFEADEELEAGDITYCPGCYADLKITRLNPVQVEEVVDEADDDYDEEY